MDPAKRLARRVLTARPRVAPDRHGVARALFL